MILVAKQSLVSIYMHHGNNHDHRPVSKYPGALRYMIMTRLLMIQCPKWSKLATLFKGSGNFASRGKIAPRYFAIWRQNSPKWLFCRKCQISPKPHANPNPNPNCALTNPKSIDGHKSVNRESVNNEANFFINSLIR